MGKTAWLISVSLCWLMASSACAGGPPSLRRCERLNLRTSQGWWLAINRDGSGEYGFGVLVARVAVAPGTFDQAKIYQESLGAWQESPLRAEDPSVAASCFSAGSSSATEYPLARKTEWSEALLCTARRNSLPPRNQFEQQWHEKIDLFWEKGPHCPEPEAVGEKGDHLP